MMNEKEIRASRGKSARNQNESIISRLTIEHLDLTPKQILATVAFVPVLYLMVLVWAVAM